MAIARLVPFPAVIDTTAKQQANWNGGGGGRARTLPGRPDEGVITRATSCSHQAKFAAWCQTCGYVPSAARAAQWVTTWGSVPVQALGAGVRGFGCLLPP